VRASWSSWASRGWRLLPEPLAPGPAPARSLLRRHRGVLAATLLTIAALALRDYANTPRLRHIDRYHLLGFDSYVYAAMVDDPAFFTVGPWGYRVLSPLLVHLSGVTDVVRGFRLLALVGLGLTGPLLFLFLRREGHAEAPSLLATAFFFLSPPCEEAFRNFFLAEPVALPLLLGALLAVQAKDRSALPVAMFAACMALGALTKEVFVVFLPGLLFAACASQGWRSGLWRAGPGVLAALAVHGGLRLAWAPYPPRGEGGLPGPAQVLSALGVILGAASSWWASLFACAFPLALVALLRPAGRDILRRHGVLVGLALALPFGAAVYTDGPFPSHHFYAEDVPRLLAYAIPVLSGLALVPLRELRPAWLRPAAGAEAGDPLPESARFAITAVFATLAVVAIALPLVVLDPYRRTDLRGRTDGPWVLSFCRESLAFARRLNEGRPVVYEPTRRRYKPGRSDPRHMERMRWFLREGWGEWPEYGMEAPEMREAEARVVLPVLEPRDVTLGLDLRAERPVAVRVEVNGHRVGDVEARPDPSRQRLSLPASTLFRGDNLISFAVLDPQAPSVGLWVLNLRAVGR
jgi:hypothetical protein